MLFVASFINSCFVHFLFFKSIIYSKYDINNIKLEIQYKNLVSVYFALNFTPKLIFTPNFGVKKLQKKDTITMLLT